MADPEAGTPLYEDPSGNAAKWTATLTSFVTVVILLVDWFRGGGLDVPGFTAAVTTFATGMFSVLVMLGVIKPNAYAPKTVNAIRNGNF